MHIGGIGRRVWFQCWSWCDFWGICGCVWCWVQCENGVFITHVVFESTLKIVHSFNKQHIFVQSYYFFRCARSHRWFICCCWFRSWGRVTWLRRFCSWSSFSGCIFGIWFRLSCSYSCYISIDFSFGWHLASHNNRVDYKRRTNAEWGHCMGEVHHHFFLGLHNNISCL